MKRKGNLLIRGKLSSLIMSKFKKNCICKLNFFSITLYNINAGTCQSFIREVTLVEVYNNGIKLNIS